MFNVIDSFDTHAKIPEHFAECKRVQQWNPARLVLFPVGWDPGMFSLNRVYANAILTRR